MTDRADSAQPGDVYRLVFDLTARATDIPYESFVSELVEAMCAHYRAAACRLHLGHSSKAAATADPYDALAGLDPDERARFDTIDALLADSVRTDGVLRTALDLDGGDEITNYLRRILGSEESFAFPLITRGQPFGAVTLYPLEPYPFSEADVRGLQAIGNVLHAARHQAGPGAVLGSSPVAVTSQKLRAYQERLDEIGRILDELIYLTAAKNVMLLDANGDFIAKRGEESDFSASSFATVAASAFAACRRLGGIYGAQDMRSVLHEGDEGNVFLLEVSDRALLCVVYGDHEAPSLLARWSASAANRLQEKYEALMEARVL
ncbi:MAG: roadblock/LC7 domain-containing protein [Planctomycetota bacterium]